MKKIVRLTESDLVRLVNRVIKEQRATGAIDSPFQVNDIISGKNFSNWKVLSVELGKIKVLDSKGRKLDLEIVPNTNKVINVAMMGGNNTLEVLHLDRKGAGMAVLPDGTLRGMGAKL